MKKYLLTLFASLNLFTYSVLADGVKDLTIGEFKFQASTPWKEATNTGMMTKAILEYPIADAPALKAMFYHFGTGQGGAVEANINRWIGQFEGTPTITREELEVNGKRVVIIRAVGTFMDGPPMGGNKTPRPNYEMLASILVGNDAPVFIKLTGPKDHTAKMYEDFKKLTLSPATP